MSIADKLKQLEKSPAFQKKVLAARMKAQQEGKAFGHRIGGNGVLGSSVGVDGGTGNADLSLARQAVEKALNDIAQIIHSEVNSIPPNFDEIFRVYEKYDKSTGKIRFIVFFEPEVVHRESLYHEGYPDGLENIVALRSHGSEPSIHSVWNRASFEYDYNRSRQFGEYRFGAHIFIPRGSMTVPSDFLTLYIEGLNAIYKSRNFDMEIHLNDKYYPD